MRVYAQQHRCVKLRSSPKKKHRNEESQTVPDPDLGMDGIEAPYFGLQLPDVPNNISFPGSECVLHVKHGLDKLLKKIIIVHTSYSVSIPRTFGRLFFPCVNFTGK